MAACTLRGIPDDFWRSVKVKAAQAGKPIRTVILELLAAWVKS